MNEMAEKRYLGIWRLNPNAPWPLDPNQAAQMNEMIFAGIDNALQTGRLLEMGFFLDGTSGYLMGSGEAMDAFRSSLAAFPFLLVEHHEIVDYETGKRITREMLKAQAEAMRG